MGPSQQGVPATLVCTQAQKGRTTVRVFGVQEMEQDQQVFRRRRHDQPRKELEVQKFGCLNEADVVKL